MESERPSCYALLSIISIVLKPRVVSCIQRTLLVIAAKSISILHKIRNMYLKYNGLATERKSSRFTSSLHPNTTYALSHKYLK